MKYFITFNDGPYGDRFSVLDEFYNYHEALESAYRGEYPVSYEELTICSDTGTYGAPEPCYPDFKGMKRFKRFTNILFEWCGQSDSWIWYYSEEDGAYLGAVCFEVNEYLEDSEDEDDYINYLLSFGIPVKIKNKE